VGQPKMGRTKNHSTVSGSGARNVAVSTNARDARKPGLRSAGTVNAADGRSCRDARTRRFCARLDEEKWGLGTFGGTDIGAEGGEYRSRRTRPGVDPASPRSGPPARTG
jgi:hypothetical protein